LIDSEMHIIQPRCQFYSPTTAMSQKCGSVLSLALIFCVEEEEEEEGGGGEE